ncbi:MAG: AAA family ATPase [Haloferacaceae archaeon]
MIVILCGPPGVGKTTVAHLLRERLRERGREFEVLDSDRFSTDTYERMFDRVAGTDADWILAGTFYKRKWQTRFERLEDVAVVHLRADLETCLERNRRREAPIDEAGVHVVWREFDEPDADVVVDVAGRSPEDVVDLLLESLDFAGE